MAERKQVAGGAPQPAQRENSKGESSFDPTYNVMALVWAAQDRLDDLRELDSKRIEQLAAAETRRIDEQLKLRAEFAVQLTVAETKRIDAIRAVDVNAVSIANERATAQASVLANQVTASAEALRTLVSSTATTFAASQQQMVSQLSERLATLERIGYEGQGKQTVADPIYQQLLAEMREMKQNSSEHRGSQIESGMSTQRMVFIVSTIIGVALVLATVLGTAVAFWSRK